MKLSVFLLSFLATSRVTLAAPAPSVDLAELPSDTSIEIRSPNPADAPLAILEQREYRVYLSISQWARVLPDPSVNMSTAVCADLSYIIQASLTLVYVAAAHYSGPSPKVCQPSVKSMLPRTISSCGRPCCLAAMMSPTTVSLHLHLAFHSDNATLARRQGEPALVHRLQVTGFALDNSPKHDIIADHYDNGDTVLQLPLPGGNSAAKGTVESSSNLHKRFDKPGFKIFFTTREKSKLSQAHQKSMALAGAAAWGVYADNAGHRMNEFIGFAETEHAANFYYRIIPEIRGFGTNYETVDVCGGMASYL